jgi:hypothetical protein
MNRILWRTARVGAAVGWLALAAGCADSVTVAPRDRAERALSAAPTGLRIVSGDFQHVGVTEEAPLPIVVEVFDGSGPLSGIRIDFYPSTGHPEESVSNPHPISDANGRVSTRWTMGHWAGERLLGIQYADLISIVATAIVSPGPPAKVVAGGQLERFLLADSARSYLFASVVDQYDNAITGRKVTFVVDSGGGSLQLLSTSDTTGTPGLSSLWRFGPTARRQVAHVEAAGLASSPAIAIGTIGTFVVVSGDSQRTRPSKPVPNPPVLRATNVEGKTLGAGFPVYFYRLIDFSFDFLDSARTDVDGLVSPTVPWVMGPNEGWNTLVVQGELEESQVRLAAFGLAPRPEKILLRSGANLSGTIGNFLPARPEVVVLDSAGQPLPGQPFLAEVIGPNGQSRSFSLQRSDSSGLVRVPSWRLGFPGLNQLRLSTPGLPPAPIMISARADTLPQPAFSLTTRFDGVFPLWLVPDLQGAVREWERAVVGDLPDVSLSLPADPAGCNPAFSGVIDDLLVFIRFASIDGPGGITATSRVCRFRGSGAIPLVSQILFDYDDLVVLDQGFGLAEVFRHMLGHALGIGAGWRQRPDLADSATSRYLGPSAISAFNWIRWRPGEAQEAADSVPLDPSGWIHWSAAAFPDIMAAVQDPRSVITPLTIAALRDLGYQVDDSRGHEVFLPGGSFGAVRWRDLPARATHRRRGPDPQ